MLSSGNMCLKINGAQHKVLTKIIHSDSGGEMTLTHLMNQDGLLMRVELSVKMIVFSTEVKFTPKTDS